MQKKSVTLENLREIEKERDFWKEREGNRWRINGYKQRERKCRLESEKVEGGSTENTV